MRLEIGGRVNNEYLYCIKIPEGKHVTKCACRVERGGEGGGGGGGGGGGFTVSGLGCSWLTWCQEVLRDKQEAAGGVSYCLVSDL